MDLPSSLPPSPSLPPISQNPVDTAASSTSISAHSQGPLIPPLPTELKREILRLCDPSTLAKTSLVSLAFLEMSSPLLYDEIEVVGFLAMSKLFCNRNPLLHQPHLEPFLSLHQIRRCTFDGRQGNHDDPNHSLYFHTDRLLPFAVVLSVESLTLEVHRSVEFSSWPIVLSLFDPTTVLCAGVTPPSMPLPSMDLHQAQWPSLRRLTFRSCLTFEHLRECPFLSHSPGNNDRVVLAFDLVNCSNRDELEEDMLEQLGGGFSRRKPVVDLEKVEKVIIQIPLVADKKRIQRDLSTEWAAYRFEESSIKQWKSRIKFEVVDVVAAEQ